MMKQSISATERLHATAVAELDGLLRGFCPCLPEPWLAGDAERTGAHWRHARIWVLGEFPLLGPFEIFVRNDVQKRIGLAEWLPGDPIPSEIAWAIGAFARPAGAVS